MGGGFVQDSLMIGQEVQYWITARYPLEQQLIFPDSTSPFSPFEFSSKQFFPTQIREGLAFDSTIYTLQSFEIEPTQLLSLDVVALSEADSVVLNSPLDSIYLRELATIVTDTTSLKTNLDFQVIDTQFNYPLLYYALGGLLLLSLILLLIFGKRLLIYFKVKKLEKDYHSFSDVFTKHIQRLKVDPQPEIAEQALASWKNYQQRLDKLAFKSATTKEILDFEFTKELEKPLKAVDRVVYGRRVQENLHHDFQQMEDFTGDRFQKRVAEIKYGK